MGKEIIRDSQIRRNKFQLLVKETPFAEPQAYEMDAGISVSVIQDKLPKVLKDKPVIYVNGDQAKDDQAIKSGDLVEVVLVPKEPVSTTTLLVALGAGLLAGFLGAKLFKPPTPDGSPEDNQFERISGLRNEERLYETQTMVLGGRKVAPHYLARPYTMIEGDEEWFYALMTTGYGPQLLEDFTIGGVSLDNFEHEIEYVDHFSRTDINPVYKAYQADITQEDVSVLLEIGGDYTQRVVSQASESIMLDFLWPAGSYRITQSRGRTSQVFSCARVDYEQNGSRRTVLRHISGISNVIRGLAFRENGQWRLRTEGGSSVALSGVEVVDDRVITANVVSDEFVVASVFHESPLKKAKAKSLTFSTNSDDPVIVYVRQDLPTEEDEESRSTTTAIQWLNLKVKRNLTLSKFEEAIGGRRPKLVNPVSISGPVQVYKPTVIALKIKATGQLSGQLDNFFCKATMCVPVNKNADWRNWTALTLEPSTNPADAYKWLLQGPANYSPIPNSKIDNDKLNAWRQTCIDEDWNIAALIDYESTLLAELRNVAYLGRAEFSFNEGKYGVVQKTERTIPVQMFTPKNSVNFQSTRNYPQVVDGIKFEFDSAEIDYEKDEGTFLDPAKEADPSQLRGRYNRQTVWGVDNFEQAYRLTRFQYYEEALQREVYTLQTDIEGLRCSRGDLVYVQNDVIRVGLGSGRIKAITSTTVTIDEQVGLDDIGSEQLAIMFRNRAGDFVLEQAEYLGEGVWQLDVPEGLNVGDLATYGVAGSEVLSCLVQEITYSDDLAVSITLVNAVNEIFTFDGTPVPEYQPTITVNPVTQVPEAPVLYETPSVDLDEGVITLTLLNTPTVRESGLFYNVQMRSYDLDEGASSATDWETVATAVRDQLEITVANLVQGQAYQFRVQARRDNSTFSAWSNTATVELDFGSEMPQVEGFGFNHLAFGTRLAWSRIENPYFDLYEIRTNSNFGDETDEANLVTTTKDIILNVGYLTSTQVYYIAAKNREGRYGEFTTLSATPPAVNSPVDLITNAEPSGSAFIQWNEPDPISYLIVGYEIRRNGLGETPSFNTASVKGLIDTTYYDVSELFSGTYPYYIRAKDASGRYSDPVGVTVEYLQDFEEAAERIAEARQRLDEAEARIQASEDDIETTQNILDEATDNIIQLEDRADRTDRDIQRLGSDQKLQLELERRSREGSDKELLSGLLDTAATQAEYSRRLASGERLIDAVVTVDPDTGQIINKAFAYTDEQFTEAGVLIDGVAGQVEIAVNRISFAEDEIENLDARIIALPAEIRLETQALISEAVSALEPAHAFNFFDSAQGWVAVNGVITEGSNSINVTWGDIENTNLNYDADENPLIRIAIERLAGSGWTGDVVVTFDDESTQTFVGVIDEIPEATNGTQFIRNIDFRGAEQYTGVITGVRLVLGSSADDEFKIDTITIGKPEAALQELEGIQARLTTAEVNINALDEEISLKLDTTTWEENAVTFGNIGLTLETEFGVPYGELALQYQEIDENDVIQNSIDAGLFLDGYTGNVTLLSQQIQQDTYEQVDDELVEPVRSSVDTLSIELDQQTNTIRQNVTSVAGIRGDLYDTKVEQALSEVDIGLYRLGAAEEGLKFARAISELQAFTTEEGAFGKAVTELEAVIAGQGAAFTTSLQTVNARVDGTIDALTLIESRVEDVEGESNASAQLLLEAELDEDGNTKATATLRSEVEDLDGDYRETAQLILDSGLDDEGNTKALALLETRVTTAEEDVAAKVDLSVYETAIGELGARAALVTDVDNRTTGVIIDDDNVIRQIQFFADAVSFVGADDTAKIFFDLNEDRYVFDGEIRADSGFFGGSLQAADGTFRGTLDAVDGNFTGSLVAADGTFEGTLAGVDGSFVGTLEAGIVAGGEVKGAVITGGKYQSSDSSGFRTVIDPANGFPFWFGSGATPNTSNSLLHMTSSGDVLFSGELAAGLVVADSLATNFVYSKTVDIVRGGRQILLTPDADLFFWAGQEGETPTKENGTFWISNDGTFSSTTFRASERGNFTAQAGVTNTYTVAHKTVKGECDIDMFIGRGSFTVANVTSYQGGTGNLRVRLRDISNGGLLFEADITVNVNYESSLNRLFGSSDNTSFTSVVDNRNLNYYSSRDYALELFFTLPSFETSVSQPSPQITLTNCTLRTLEIRELDV